MNQVNTDLFENPVPPPRRTAFESRQYVRGIQEQIERTLAVSAAKAMIEKLRPGSFARVANEVDNVGREIVATMIDESDPEFSTATLVCWNQGERQDLVVEVGALSDITAKPGLIARYAFDRLDTAEGTLRVPR